jgi:sterol desaturase/sphingolipid hydroxylase (fatty acid hydroxylase superfamily)
MEVLFEEVPNIFTYFLPIFALSIIVEAYISHREDRKLYDWRDLVASTSVGIVAAIINTFTKGIQVGFFFFFYEIAKPLRENYLGYENLGWAWWVWVLCIFGDDFNFYWHHRFSHNVRILWAAHLVHHSSEKFNFGTAFRNGWTIFFYKPIFWIWMPILGFHPLMVGLALSINSIYQFFLHCTLIPNLGWFGKLFNTPFVHQVHHACNVEYLDRNHGGIFIIWDKLFGTFQDNEKGISPKFGVLHPPHTHNPVTLNFHEFVDIWHDVKQAKSWEHKIKYIFYPPGWSPDGSRKTAKQLQGELALQEKKSESLKATVM